ncbi:hypothetical protein ACQZV8_18720, partial [Magnetococcales bacterium HHB-1]
HIIMARFLRHSLKRYHKIVEQTDRSSEMISGFNEGKLKRINYDYIPETCLPHTLGQWRDGHFFFSCRHFATLYVIDESLPINAFWHRLQHINLRNRLTSRLLRLILSYQSDFLVSGEPSDLKIYLYRDIVAHYQKRWPDNYIDESIISRIVHGKNLLDQQGRAHALTDLLPSKSLWLGHQIAALIKEESTLGDRDLVFHLQKKFNIKVSRRYVSRCRRKAGILSLRERKERARYMGTIFGEILTFDKTSLQNLSWNLSGVYELRWREERHHYPKGVSSINYIGSAKSLRRRLLAHLNDFSHLSKTETVFQQKKMDFRFFATTMYRSLEAQLIDSFLAEFGALPQFNRVKPKPLEKRANE